MTIAASNARQGIIQADTLGLMLAIFTVAIAYGITLPALPSAVSLALGAGTRDGDVAWHTGSLASIYLLAQFLLAPICGRLGDRVGERAVLIGGLIGLGASLAAAANVLSIEGLYIERGLSGMFAAAVAPSAMSALTGRERDDARRGRLVVLANMANMAGFLLGPMLGVLLSRILAANPPSMLSVLLWMVAILAFSAACAVALTLGAAAKRAIPEYEPGMQPRHRGTQSCLHVFALLLALGVASFEVGLSLRESYSNSLSQTEVAIMLAECSVVMFVAQVIWLAPKRQPRLVVGIIGPAILIFGISILASSLVDSFPAMLVVTGMLAASAGIGAPALVYWTTLLAGTRQATEIGKQAAASSLGGAIGSLLAGNVAGGPYQLISTAGVSLALVLAGWTAISLAREGR